MTSCFPSRRPSNSRISFCLSLIVLLLAAYSNPALAKMTEPPTTSPAPSLSPAPSDFPSESPSLSPSLSSAPSSFPSESPSLSPSLEPTSTPSISSAPSIYETPAPTSNATETPTLSPTISPTKDVLSVRLPTIGLDVIVSDVDSSSKSKKGLEDDIAAFIQNLLETIVDSFDYVTLDFDVIRSSFRRRRLATGLSIRIDGTAHFGSNPPSPEDLSGDLRNYFAVWGIEDMQNYLRTVGLPSSQIALLTIEGDAVKPASGMVDYNPGAKVQAPSQETGASTSIGVIAGLAAASTVLVVVLVYLLVKNRKIQSASMRAPRAQSNHENSPGDELIFPKTLSQTQSARISDESDAFSGDDDSISVDMSLYTTEESLAKPSSATKSYYDPKRLDKVIHKAKSQPNVSKLRLSAS